VIRRGHRAVARRHATLIELAGPLSAIGVVIPGMTYLLTRVLFAVIALVRILRDEPAPRPDDLMLSSPGWPPFITPSFPFWVSLPLLLGMAFVTIWRPRMIGHAYRSGFVAMYLGLSGGWSLLFAFSFPGTSEWPRDSIIPGVVMLAACVLVTCVAFRRLLRFVWHRVRSRTRPTVPAMNRSHEDDVGE